MHLLAGLTVLLAYQLLGETLVLITGVPVPGPVLGMVALFATLVVRGELSARVEPAASGLLSHLSLLFVPAGVGVSVHLARLGDEWLPISAALVVSTIVGLAASALAMQGVSRALATWRRRR